MEEEKTENLSPPELIFPCGRPREWEGDKTFEKDLELELILEKHPYSQKVKDNWGDYIISPHREILDRALSLNTDMETAKYRQEVFRDLENDDTRREFYELCGYLGRLPYHSDFRGIGSGLAMLKNYVAVLENIPDFLKAESRGLKEPRDYLRRVKETENLDEIKQFIEYVENLESIEFKVTLDDSLNPEKMSVLELKTKETEEKPEAEETEQKRNFFERLFGKKEYEERFAERIEQSEGNALYREDYRGERKLNELGEIIDNFINEQFRGVINSYLKQIRELASLGKSLEFYEGFTRYFENLKDFYICVPELLPQEERKMKVRNARNPLLKETRNNDHKVIPNDIEYDRDNNLFVITGPNNGGKTTYVKTVGLIQLLAQAGLPIPAESGEISFVDGIYTHFVAPDDITKGEGRYRNELRRMKEIFERATSYSLVILDEPCGGTSYEEGQRQSLVLLDAFHRLGSATYFTTHIHPLTKEVDKGRYPAGKNLQVECVDDGKKIKYTYRVIPGSSGKSYGEEIAREIGLIPESIMDTISRIADKKGHKGLLRK